MTRSPRNGSAAAARPESVQSHPGNGCDRGAVQCFPSGLSADALRILGSMTRDELRALVRHIDGVCMYGGKDEAAAMRGARKLHDAAGVA